MTSVSPTASASSTASSTSNATATASVSFPEPPTEPDATTWTDVCALADLLPDRGAAALVGGRQIALFRLDDGALFAIGNTDPTTGANVLARGLVGSRGERAVVFSPLHKQAFDLATGVCLDVPGASVPTYPVEVRDGRVFVGM